ncbi:MAG: DUF3347 domain-containing protein [Ignavibacteria bacterium]|nr:DUF3347 domain-containing protein [Ignavibacteria bacterium]
MKKILIVLFCLSVSAGSYLETFAETLNPPEDSVKTHHSNKDIHKKNYDVIITFDNSKLAPQNVRIIFNELFGQYIKVKDALVYNDSYNAVRNMLQLLDDMKAKTKYIDILNKDDRWVLFIMNYDMIRKKIESATLIRDRRFLFNEITNGLQTFIKQYGLNDKTIYLMQNESSLESGNGIWFSTSDDKKNPYRGLTNDTTYAKVLEVWKF